MPRHGGTGRLRPRAAENNRRPSWGPHCAERGPTPGCPAGRNGPLCRAARSTTPATPLAEAPNTVSTDKASGRSTRKTAGCCISAGSALPFSGTSAHVRTSTRFRASRTDEACHVPPRAVRTPRALSASAMARKLLRPARCTSRMMGTTLAARCSASTLRLCREASCATSSFGPPSLTPRRLAAASASLVRCACQDRGGAAQSARR